MEGAHGCGSWGLCEKARARATQAAGCRASKAVCVCARGRACLWWGVTENNNQKGTPGGGSEGETLKCVGMGGVMSMCRRRWCARECVPHGEPGKRCLGSAGGVAAMASAADPVPEVGAGPRPRVGALTEQKIPPSSPWSHRRQITMSPGREVEKEAQMCVPYICPQQNLWAFICLCLCPGVHACACVRAAGCVSVPVFVSVCIWAFVSVCVAVGLGLPT